MNSLKRIQGEIRDAENNPVPNIITSYSKVNVYKWSASLIGPEGSPYEGGLFYLDINIPKNYPFSPPKIVFNTKIFHCNIGDSGEICLDILKEKWSPALTILKILLSICSLLNEPNPNDPLVLSTAELYKNDKEAYVKKAKEYTIKYAI